MGTWTLRVDASLRHIEQAITEAVLWLGDQLHVALRPSK